MAKQSLIAVVGSANRSQSGGRRAFVWSKRGDGRESGKRSLRPRYDQEF